MARVRTPWTPPNTDGGGTAQVGVAFQSNVSINVSGVWWYHRTNGPANITAKLWRVSDQTLVADSGSVSTSGYTIEAWNLVTLPSTVTIPNGVEHIGSIVDPTVSSVGYDPDDLTSPITSSDGHVTFPAGGGRFKNTSPIENYPSSTWNGLHAVDIEYSLSGIVPVTQAIENNTAQTINQVKTRTLGQSLETDLAFNILHPFVQTLGMATELNVAQFVQLGSHVVLPHDIEVSIDQVITANISIHRS